jgi:hypothetical protein
MIRLSETFKENSIKGRTNNLGMSNPPPPLCSDRQNIPNFNYIHRKDASLSIYFLSFFGRCVVIIMHNKLVSNKVKARRLTALVFKELKYMQTFKGLNHIDCLQKNL